MLTSELLHLNQKFTTQVQNCHRRLQTGSGGCGSIVHPREALPTFDCLRGILHGSWSRSFLSTNLTFSSPTYPSRQPCGCSTRAAQRKTARFFNVFLRTFRTAFSRFTSTKGSWLARISAATCTRRRSPSSPPSPTRNSALQTWIAFYWTVCSSEGTTQSALKPSKPSNSTTNTDSLTMKRPSRSSTPPIPRFCGPSANSTTRRAFHRFGRRWNRTRCNRGNATILRCASFSTRFRSGKKRSAKWSPSVTRRAFRSRKNSDHGRFFWWLESRLLRLERRRFSLKRVSTWFRRTAINTTPISTSTCTTTNFVGFPVSPIRNSITVSLVAGERVSNARFEAFSGHSGAICERSAGRYDGAGAYENVCEGGGEFAAEWLGAVDSSECCCGRWRWEWRLGIGSGGECERLAEVVWQETVWFPVLFIVFYSDVC